MMTTSPLESCLRKVIEPHVVRFWYILVTSDLVQFMSRLQNCALCLIQEPLVLLQVLMSDARLFRVGTTTVPNL
jgi:hypothetical protein